MKQWKILVVNPGSTSTKIAVFDNLIQILDLTLRHSSEMLKSFVRVADQFEFRKKIILDALLENRINPQKLDAVIGRGGLVKPIPSGVYEVNEALKQDLITPPQGEHASNLGGLIAADLVASIPGAKAYIADPVVVDEMDEVARITGHPLFKRASIFHALNQKSVARLYATEVEKPYESLRLIVAHLGGGVSVGAHSFGRIVDVNNALDGEGPFSAERSGTLPAGALARLCFSGEYTPDQVQKMLTGNGGLVALLGSNNVVEILERCDHADRRAQLVLDAMSYNVAKWIGAMASVLKGEVDAILLTGGVAYSQRICKAIEERVRFIAPVTVFAGENEMEALAQNALRALRKEVDVKIYA